MSIAEVLLFIASNSRACMPCMDFKTHHQFPAQIIRLDSESARDQAANGSFFQVTNVPTMVVIYNDGNTQMFIGSPKIIQWMTMIIKSEKEESAPETGIASYMPAGGNMYGPRPNPPRPHDYREAPKRVVVEEYNEEESEEEEVEIIKSPPRPKKKPAPAPKSKKKKPPPVSFEEDEGDDVQYIEHEAPRSKSKKQPKAPSAPASKKPAQPSRMANIQEAARRMEQERKSSLGYKEEDLPRY